MKKRNKQNHKLGKDHIKPFHWLQKQVYNNRGAKN